MIGSPKMGAQEQPGLESIEEIPQEIIIKREKAEGRVPDLKATQPKVSSSS